MSFGLLPDDSTILFYSPRFHTPNTFGVNIVIVDNELTYEEHMDRDMTRKVGAKVDYEY